ncbi:leucine-rich repeat protein, partial [Mycoplasma sp. BRA290]|uniref:leucine-rich repeat protein n=1 Tax=Mycoplasma sp. BRA290 TaxID=3401675 RepID=UPI003AAE9125
MKRKKLFILFSLASASSIIAMPLVAGSCDNKNNDNKTEPTPIVTPGPNPGTTPKPSPVTKPGSGKEQPGKEQPGKEQPGKEQPGKEQPGRENNIYSFVYPTENEKTDVKYYKNENRILIPQAHDITASMLEYIFNNLDEKFKLRGSRDNIILECPNAINICSSYNNSHTAIKKLILPKIENIFYYHDIKQPFTALNEFLEDDKVIQNGILFKWANASGDIVDDSITSIANGAFENNSNITSVSFPNVASIGDWAFKGVTNLTSVNMPKLKEVGWYAFENTPKLTNKIVGDGILFKWANASGDIA